MYVCIYLSLSLSIYIYIFIKCTHTSIHIYIYNIIWYDIIYIYHNNNMNIYLGFTDDSSFHAFQAPGYRWCLRHRASERSTCPGRFDGIGEVTWRISPCCQTACLMGWDMLVGGWDEIYCKKCTMGIYGMIVCTI